MKVLRALPIFACLLLAVPAHAGVYADSLARCIVGSTSKTDRMDLVRWMFTAASLHPAVKPISSMTEADLKDSNRTIARMMERLLTDTCRDETLEAVNYEGANSIVTAFEVLGQVAGQELFASPEVAQALAGLEREFDAEKLEGMFGAPD